VRLPSLAIILPAGLAVAGAWLGFPNTLLHLPPAVLLFPACLIFLAAQTRRPGRAFRVGLLTGGLAFAASLYWVAVPVHDYAYMPWALAAPLPVLLGLALGVYTGVFTMLLSRCEGRLPWLLQALLAGLLWGALEWLRGVLFTGFPWLTLASAFSFWPTSIQGVSVVGTYGLGALAVFGVALVVRAALPGGPQTLPFVLGALLLAAPPLWGQYALSRPLPAQETALVGLVQGNIDQSMKWDDAYQRQTVETYNSLTGSMVMQQNPARLDLVVWPETAMPFYFQESRDLSRSVRRLARDLGTPLLTGAPGYEKLGPREYELYNRAFLLDATGAMAGVYEKEHLVPFGEYVPFREALPFLNKLVPGIGDFRKGTQTGPLEVGRLALGMLICYEAIFPELAQDRVAEGANLLVNISNDAWYGRSSAAPQHLALSLLRAVEQQRSMVRATNTGISAIIDPRGRILAQAGFFVAGTRTAEVGLHRHFTTYHRIQPLVAPVLAAGAGLLLLLGLLLKPSAPASPTTIQ